MGSDHRHGDFEALLRPHLDSLYRMAYRFTGHSEDAEDLVQELLLHLYRSSQDLAQIAALRPWLKRSLYHLFVDQWRRRQRTPFGHLYSEPWEALFENAASTAAPERDIQAAELRHQVLHALYGLGKEHRALLVLHDMEGRELPELADLLHLPLGTLKSRLFRARRKLREALGNGNPAAGSGVIRNEVSEYEL
ncbi:MAG: RNA polymerase sigma factor [Gammaproteobacteria bacterium]|nr:RNA polymerase sigma factor [Gammaproteobacteria bacterium]MDE1984307.1 RNA polymerase sigma factor [Gammaproteobacteria bacterium]MDE2108877.1 RNA polymerase sigma factor [Gammaproteobacteria bacterium]MDE2462010.1 RNA polymerase sigma factor [Gammaproteobacteria bacterium]